MYTHLTWPTHYEANSEKRLRVVRASPLIRWLSAAHRWPTAPALAMSLRRQVSMARLIIPAVTKHPAATVLSLSGSRNTL